MTYDLTAVRAQFPALSLPHRTGPGHDDPAGSRPRIYVDNPAGTQVPEVVLEAMRTALVDIRANTHGLFPTSEAATDLSHRAHVAMAEFHHARSEREIVFGPNMTTLTFQFARLLGPRFSPGDEIIVTHMEHDGNNTPWRRMAADHGLVVRTLPFDRDTYEFDLAELDALITDRTRFAALNFASNLLGTINPIAAMCQRLRDAGAITYVDAVQYAPHGPIDVRALGCHFLVSSAYKWYGPHQAVLWGDEELLGPLSAYHLEVVPDTTPDKFEPGTQSLEAQAGVLGAVEYLERLGRTVADGRDDHQPGVPERTRLVHAALRSMADHEILLSERLIGGLESIGGIRIHGITDRSAFDRRVPTVSFTRPGLDPADCAAWLGRHGVYVWHGHSYALPVVRHLGLEHQGGVVRIGPTHYNTLDEIDTVVDLVARYVATVAP